MSPKKPRKQSKNTSLPVPAIGSGEFLLFQTDDGRTRVQVRIRDETVWLSLNQLAELFGRDKSSISKHITNVFEEGELLPDRTIAKFATVQDEGTRSVAREIEHYNLDVIISVGYRVKSHRGTQFRIWATERLREYIVKGFTMDDERLKESGGGNYFDELLSRIRDIRSSEKIFWKKVLEIYATSIDYDPKIDSSVQFFNVVQNKMHWAAHGRTAAEIIAERADAAQLNMGLTSWQGERPKRSDTQVAKNYLSADELDTLNRIVSFYLDFAELQAKQRKPMYMKDWLSKLDDFLKVSEREILTHAGKISHEAAVAKASQEFDKYLQTHSDQPSMAECDFDKAVEQAKLIKKTKPRMKS
jgi:hypothetical protein